MAGKPILTLQTGTLYASGDDSTFTGTGGPWGYSPWTSQFGGVVSSAGLDGEPFADTVFDVAAGDEVTFVIAVQNRATAAPTYDLHVQATLPTGFVTPPEGMNLTVTDGTGTDLPVSGNLFAAGGIAVGTTLAGYDPNSGLNLVLVTYTLQAATSLPAVNATVLSTASIPHFAASSGGADLSATGPAPVSTTIVTAAPTPLVQAETDPSAVAAGQKITFDITIPVPNGTLQNVHLHTALPGGSANLVFVSASVVSVGAGLQTGTPVVSAGGDIAFGTVVNTGTATTDAAQEITARVVVQAAGTASGPATLQTVLSAADPSSVGGTWSATVASSVGVVVPPTPPVIGGTIAGQHATTASIAYPFAGLTLMSTQANQQGTLAITLQDNSLGRLGGTALGSFDAAGGSFVATGSIAALQAAARQIVFSSTAAGTEHFTVTLVDAVGGTAQDGTTSTVATAPAGSSPAPQPFAPAMVAPSPAQSGSVNAVQGQTASGATATIALVTPASTGSSPSFIASAAAQLASGQAGSAVLLSPTLLIGGTGTVDFFLQAASTGSVSDTIIGFHAGDVLTVFGYVPGTSRYAWTAPSGATGYQGSTLQIDVSGQGHPATSIVFTGATTASTAAYVVKTGQTGSVPYLTISG